MYRLSKPVIRLYGRLLKLDVQRHAPLAEGAKIIVANHPSTSDPFLIALVTGEPARILIIDHAFRVPVFGAYLRGMHHIPVTPGAGHAAFETATCHLQDGGTLIIFPEGGLSPLGGGFRDPHTGAARLALITGTPIIPMGISLSPESLWHTERKYGGKLAASRWALHGPYGVTVGQPVYLDGDVEDRAYVSQASRRVMQHIIELAEESQQRLEAPVLWPSILEPSLPA